MRMKLSDAIRLGSMATPQGFGHYKEYGRMCAMGAAFHAVGGIVGAFKHLDTPKRKKLQCPQCAHCSWFAFEDFTPVKQMIIHLNDSHRWSREAIADFVERLEHEDETQETTTPKVLVEVLV